MPHEHFHTEVQTFDYQELVEDEGGLSDATSTVTTPPPERVNEDKSSNFVSRVSSIPIIQDSVSFANKTTLGKFAISTAISTASTTLNTVHKYQPKYLSNYYDQYIQPQVQKADELGCRSLDLIQKKYPVVNSRTDDLVQLIDVQQVNKKLLGPVVDSIETVVNKYLPNEQEKKKIQDENQALRAYYILNDATNRLSQRTIETTQEFVQRSTLNIQSLQQQLLTVTQQAIPSVVVERAQSVQSTTTQTIESLTQQVSIQIETVLTFIKTQSNENSPDWLKSQINSILDITNNQLELIRKEYTRTDIQTIDKAKNIAQSIQLQILPVLQLVQSQLVYYSDLAREKASKDLKLPFEYLGLRTTTTAQ